MRKLVLSAALFLALVAPALMPAQEPPDLQLKFVKELRDRGLSELALEYLEKLQAQKNPPSPLTPILPVEIARTQVILSRVKAPKERMTLLQQAEKGLKAYLAKKSKTNEAPQLNLEIARVNYYQGQAQLGQGLRQDKIEDKIAYALKARQQLQDSRKLFDAALESISKLHDNLKKPASPKEKEFKEELASDLLEGKFDRAKTYIDEARTYVDPEADIKERTAQAELYEEAYEVLKNDVIDAEKGVNDEVRWLAGAWAIDVARRADKGQKAEDYYKLLTNPSAQYPKEAAAAQRWARYFYILGIRDDHFHPPQGVKATDYIKALAESWVKDYKKYLDTPEGQGVQYELAHVYFQKAAKISKNYDDKNAKPWYDAAQEKFSTVADGNSDLSEEANQYNIKIKLMRIGQTTSIDQLQNFEECFLKARYEMFQLQNMAVALKKLNEELQDAPPKDRDELKKKLDEGLKKRKDRFKNIQAAFNRALLLVTPQTPKYKIEEVRYFQTYIYLISGDSYRAAVLGDYLTRKNTKDAPLAANYALQAYESILYRFDEKANRNRMKSLAQFIVDERSKIWKNEPVTDEARYQLAMIHLRQKDYADTIAQLEKLPKDYYRYTFAKCQLALVANNLAQEAQKANDEQKATEYQEKMLLALRSIGKLPEKADPATIQMFFTAQLQGGIVMYNRAVAYRQEGKDKIAEAKYKEMAKFTNDLLDQFDSVAAKLPEKAREDIGNSLQNLGKYARLSEARMAYQDGNYDLVLKQENTGKIVDDLLAAATGKDEVLLSDVQVTGELLGLAMRAHVQKGNFKEAEKILEVVQKLKHPNPLVNLQDPISTRILRSMIADLASQVQTLRKEKQEDKLKTTVKNFSTFLDVLVKQKDAKSLTYNDIAFLANCYASIEQNKQAAELYDKLEMPAAPMGKKLSKEEEAKLKKDQQLWWFMQVRCGEQWRKAKEYKKAKEVLTKVLADDKAVGKLQAQQELIYVYEDEGDYLQSIQQWNKFLKNPGLIRQMTDTKYPETVRAKAKEIYYDAYYHYVYSWYHYSQDKGKGKEQKWLSTAANYIVRLKATHDKAMADAQAKNKELTSVTGWQLIGEELESLLKEYPKLKREYDVLMAKTAGTN